MNARAEVVAFLLREGCEPGSSIHGWRCEHPDRYGPCDCVPELSRDLLGTLGTLIVSDEVVDAITERTEDAEQPQDWHVVELILQALARHLSKEESA